MHFSIFWHDMHVLQASVVPARQFIAFAKFIAVSFLPIDSSPKKRYAEANSFFSNAFFNRPIVFSWPMMLLNPIVYFLLYNFFIKISLISFCISSIFLSALTTLILPLDAFASFR